MLYDILLWLQDILLSINAFLQFIGNSIVHIIKFLAIIPDSIMFLFEAIEALPAGLEVFATGTVVVSVLMLIAGVIAGVFL